LLTACELCKFTLQQTSYCTIYACMPREFLNEFSNHLQPYNKPVTVPFMLVYHVNSWMNSQITSKKAQLVLLIPEFFPQQYTFVYMPCLQVLQFCSVCSSGAKPGGTSAHGGSTLAITLMIFMTTQEPSNWGSSGPKPIYGTFCSVRCPTSAHCRMTTIVIGLKGLRAPFSPYKQAGPVSTLIYIVVGHPQQALL